MEEKVYTTPLGDIHYWIQWKGKDAQTLVFLPGLTADHRLFDKQIEYFANKANLFVWDAPGHASSYPFSLRFSMDDEARWLMAILRENGFSNFVLVGQSLGGYIGQVFTQLFPGALQGFVAIDSAPLQRCYITKAELWLLKRMEPVYRYLPWQWLLKQGTRGVATTEYGRKLMRSMMLVYDGDQPRYAAFSGHGFRMLAEAIETNRPYSLTCPVLLICGTKDQAGSCRRYAKAWHKKTGFPLVWIEKAGHNSNTDAPAQVNSCIERLMNSARKNT
ncbi:alpha/beta fold hydrolase [uncultured Dubosiella sp.]|uniref:alpha/beta fold hydrolase n=1 Tax=uncultured Dubosiella sp. TaxID=1937011 RepID=UPI0025B379D2|nr:alpha/beta hydrolase [uncultured Dubosiella sp.]